MISHQSSTLQRPWFLPRRTLPRSTSWSFPAWFYGRPRSLSLLVSTRDHAPTMARSSCLYVVSYRGALRNFSDFGVRSPPPALQFDIVHRTAANPPRYPIFEFVKRNFPFTRPVNVHTLAANGRFGAVGEIRFSPVRKRVYRFAAVKSFLAIPRRGTVVG